MLICFPRNGPCRIQSPSRFKSCLVQSALPFHSTLRSWMIRQRCVMFVHIIEFKCHHIHIFLSNISILLSATWSESVNLAPLVRRCWPSPPRRASCAPRSASFASKVDRCVPHTRDVNLIIVCQARAEVRIGTPLSPPKLMNLCRTPRMST